MSSVASDSIDIVTVNSEYPDDDTSTYITAQDIPSIHEMSDNRTDANPTGTGNGNGNGGGGRSNDGALTRARRRVVGNTAAATVGANVTRNYQVADTVQFTNFTELKNDMISPEYSQEIIEEVMTVSGVDMGNSNATRMVEDVIFTFYVENAASQKTGHEKVVDIYGVEFDMMTVLNVLVSHGVTPRRFTRGLAARIHRFLRLPDNEKLRADLVRRYSLNDPDHAAIAFDGSTHVPNIPNDQKQVADMLASRGIFETVASAKNATDRATYDGALGQSQMRAGALHLN